MVIVYGSSLALLLSLLQIMELRFIIYDHAFEVYAGLLALLFTGIGIWLSVKLTAPRVERIVVEKKVFTDRSAPFLADEEALAKLGISLRELAVLELMAQGLSNREIAASLFVSLNTVKTHAARLFEKLDVQRRTQAVERGKARGLIR
ncbi:MAG: hypothetical protein RLZZ28_2275 [Bacteroidota bacterium]